MLYPLKQIILKVSTRERLGYPFPSLLRCGRLNMKAYAEQFYKSKAWQKCRAGYSKSVGGLCEKCLAEGIVETGAIVHHKIHISPETITIPEVALSYENLELLCRRHHAEQHGKAKRYTVDELGRVTPL